MTTETRSGATPPDAVDAEDTLADDVTADFVTFVVDGETYAFPMDAVQEIIRLPRTVRVPLGPPALAGLANLRGRVLPVVSLRSCCGLAEAEPDDATRVIVVDGGATLGFVVDRVASVTSVEVDRVEPAARVQAAVGSDLVSGIVKPGNGSGAPAGARDGGLVKVLDVHRLVATQFRVLDEAGVRTGAARGPAVAGPVVTDDADGADDTLEFVSFTVDGQEYALPIDRVQEIVQAPEQVTSVPHARPHVLGVMDLRGGLLPVVGLRRVFGLADAGLSPDNRIVVVQLPADDGHAPALVGIVMDTVREVLRVPRDVVTDLPELMARGGRARHIESVCRLGDGDRLVSVLALEEVFGEPALREAVREAAADPDADLDADPDAHDDPQDATAAPHDTTEDTTVTGDPGAPGGQDDGDALLVVFRLGEEEYGVDVDRVQEIIRVPDTLIRVPKAPGFVEGLVNLRGSVLPVVDLRTRLGLERGERDERQRIVVLSVAGVRTGFVVDSVAAVLPVGRDLLEPAPELSADTARVVTGVANLTGTRRMLLLLETDELVGSDELAALVPHQRRAAEPAVAG